MADSLGASRAREPVRKLMSLPDASQPSSARRGSRDIAEGLFQLPVDEMEF